MFMMPEKGKAIMGVSAPMGPRHIPLPGEGDDRPDMVDRLRRLKQIHGQLPMPERTGAYQTGADGFPYDAGPQVPHRPAGIAFRKSFIAETASEQIGVGIIAYHGLSDVQRALASIEKQAKGKYHVCIWDNSEDDEVEEWCAAKAPWAHCEHSGENIGCANARNRLAEAFAKRGIQRFVIQDQDVEWCCDVPALMGKWLDRYPKTGQVTLPLALKQMGAHKWDTDGLVSPPETPGMCCMYTLEAVAAGDDPDLVGWCPDYFMYRFDTDFSFALGTKGYEVRVAVDGEHAVKHNHPHSGILRYPRWRNEQARSIRIFAERRQKYGWPAI